MVTLVIALEIVRQVHFLQDSSQEWLGPQMKRKASLKRRFFCNPKTTEITGVFYAGIETKESVKFLLHKIKSSIII